ncbi:MAG: ABC transporter ATP-binding protein [Oscillospiraceae bacterium]|nr:ABC transporter ATP-binding protein [Oscillospiraceae bacterium]
MGVFQKLKKQLHKEDPQQLKREVLWLLQRMMQYRGKILVIVLLGLTGTAMGLVSSVASKYLIDAVTGFGSGLLARSAVLMALMMLGSLLFQGISSRIGAQVHVRVRNEMQHKTYTRILRAGWEALEPYRSGDLLNRLNADVNTVSDGVINFLPALLTSVAKFLGAFCIILYYDPVMAVIALMGVPVMLVLSRLLMHRLRSHNLEMKELTGEVMSFQEDSFRNLTSIKAFSLADRFESEMKQLQSTYINAYLSYNAFQISMSSFLSLVGMLVTASCFAWGVYQLWNGSITYGSLTLFLQLASTLRGSFSALVSLAQQLISMTTSAGRILAVEELPEEAMVTPSGLEREQTLDIVMERVSFRYRDGDTVLEPFDFTARHGDLIAIIGPSGEGKTTLLRLLLGLVEPNSGKVALTGGSGTNYFITAGTRSVFAYVPQGNSVFSGTIAENLRLVRPEADDEELEEVLKIACAWDFVSRFPEGLEHRLGAGGRGISEGQAQRLAIARALLRKAPVLLLDEATSGLDINTERQLLNNLRQSGLLHTCILVTHRPESARFCSRTYEIHRRRVTEVTDGV